MSTTLIELLALPGNKYCADCDAPHPTWASINNTVFICTQCAGIHRSLGVQYSFVQSVSLDEWSVDKIEKMEAAVSTSYVNKNSLEYHVPDSVLKPNPHSSREQREDYIQRKYVRKEFLKSRGNEAKPPVSIPRSIKDEEEYIKSVGEIEFIGILMIKLISAKDLMKADIIGTSDPYVKFKIGDQEVKSKKKYNNLNPVFNEALMLSWDGTDKMRVEVWDYDRFTDDDPIGWCEVDLSSLQEFQTRNDISESVHLDLPLNDVKHGSIQLELIFNSLKV